MVGGFNLRLPGFRFRLSLCLLKHKPFAAWNHVSDRHAFVANAVAFFERFHNSRAFPISVVPANVLVVGAGADPLYAHRLLGSGRAVSLCIRQFSPNAPVSERDPALDHWLTLHAIAYVQLCSARIRIGNGHDSFLVIFNAPTLWFTPDNGCDPAGVPRSRRSTIGLRCIRHRHHSRKLDMRPVMRCFSSRH
jgi:hypothetical protein